MRRVQNLGLKVESMSERIRSLQSNAILKQVQYHSGRENKNNKQRFQKIK